MLLPTLSPSNFIEPQNAYLVKAIYGGFLFIAKSSDFQHENEISWENPSISFGQAFPGLKSQGLRLTAFCGQNLPRFESESNQDIQCSFNCNASRHNINSKLKSHGEKWYKIRLNVPR